MSSVSKSISQDSHKPQRIAIIGGGISGLSAACYLHEELRSKGAEELSNSQIVLFESSSRVGGVIETLDVSNLSPHGSLPFAKIVEKGADNFATLMPDALELSRLVGAQNMLIKPRLESRLARVVCRGEIYPIPEGFSLMQPTRLLPLLKSPVLSIPGKLRVLYEYFVSANGSDEDESLKSFAIRRLGSEAFDRLVEPIIGGIFTADAGLLSMKAAMPQFVEMERKHGGLIRAARATASHLISTQPSLESHENQIRQSSQKATGARYDQFLAPQSGMNAWIEQIAGWLPAGVVQLNSPIHRVSRNHGGQWLLESSIERSDLQGLLREPFDALIIAAPSKVAGMLLQGIDSELGESLASIQYADSAVVCLCVDRNEISPDHLCFGIVVPRIEGRNCLAISLTSEKYEGRMDKDKVLLRIFMGGAVRPELINESDTRLTELAWLEAQSLLRLKTKPSWSHVVRWPSAMPQYHVGHLARLQSLESRVNALPRLALAGNAYRGVGIPQCVRSGKNAAKKVLATDQKKIT
jgi:oxygen-dependent protoporphyrinogen oxidase